MNGYYYIFAPAGGVATGWQTVLRSRNVFGPYEDKIVLAQGETSINGPHQGGYVELENGDGWFVHFQDLDPYGRITHLQPVTWQDGWPVMGIDGDGDGTGEPVRHYTKPAIGKAVPIAIPQTSDEFESDELGLQWQWHANPKSEWHNVQDGALLLHSQPMPAEAINLWPVPNLLLLKFPAPNFSATIKITFVPNSDGEKSGLIIMGLDYAYLAVEKTANGLALVQAVCHNADEGAAEQLHQRLPIESSTVYLKVDVTQPGVCSFSFSLDGKESQPFGEEFPAQPGKWIGAKVGLFAVHRAGEQGGHAVIDYVRIE
ncbi:family 43 glycosylhydrolase [candidate division KSB1 bacterium]|nr:family 43 glycosylhydrolase [candidate division KSB1 bacterium]